MATKTSLKKQIPFVFNLAVQIASPLGSLHPCYCSFLKATEFKLPNALIFSSHIRLTLQDIAAECPVFHLQSASESRPPKVNPFLGGLKFTLARAASPCVLWVLRWPTSLKEQGTKVFVVASGWSPSFLLTA